MNRIAYVFLLLCSVASKAELSHFSMAQTLDISQELAAGMIKRIGYIDRLNTAHAVYYPILSDAFLKERDYKIGCEIGVFTGEHARFILAHSNVEKLYCVDPYRAPMNAVTIITEGFDKKYWQACWDTMYYYALDKLSVFGDRSQFIRLPAEQAASMITDESLDFVFIDGDHSYIGALTDCINYYSKVRSGGIIAGDDYDIDDVGRAVNDFFKQKNLIITIYPGQKRFWWVEKP